MTVTCSELQTETLRTALQGIFETTLDANNGAVKTTFTANQTTLSATKLQTKLTKPH